MIMKNNFFLYNNVRKCFLSPCQGRCVPDFGILNGVEEKNSSIAMGNDGPPILGDNGDKISASNVFDAIKYLTDLLNLRGLAEKVSQ